MPKQVWIIASVLSALVVIGVIGFSMWEQDRQSAELRATLEQSRSQIDTLKASLANSKGKIEELQEQKEAALRTQKNLEQEMRAALRTQKSLEQEMRAALESKDITISQLQGKLTVNILDRILFDSGEAVLKPEGEGVLKKIAGILAQYPNRQIHVIGHTDNVPIKASARNRFASNWELSTARATAAVRFLSEQAGVDPRRLGALGYGEYHPVADNATPDGRAKNRRIALVVLSEELAGSDAVARAVLPSHPAARAVPATTNLAALVTNTAADLGTNAVPVLTTNTASDVPPPESNPAPAAKPQETSSP